MKPFNNIVRILLSTTGFFYPQLVSSIDTPLHRVRVAVIGAGISGVQVASALASIKGEDGGHIFDVSIFEKGRGCGGRASSRKHKKKNTDLWFDHGCPSIEEAKTPQFKKILSSWEKRGFGESFDARFASVEFTKTSASAIDTKTLFVPKLSMANLAQSIMDTTSNTNGVKSYFGSEVLAQKQIDGKWEIIDRSRREPVGQGNFDWLISTDRNFVDIYETAGGGEALPKKCAKLDGFFRAIGTGISSSPILSVMLCFKDMKIPFSFDAAQIFGHPLLSYISVESSKPSRMIPSAEGSTSIVLHSTPTFAKEIIDHVTRDVTGNGICNGAGNENESVDDVQKKIAEKIKAAVSKEAEDPLLGAFHEIMLKCFDIKSSDLGTVFFTKGQRWGAARPNFSYQLSHSSFISSFPEKNFIDAGHRLSYVDGNLKFAAVGDYFGDDETIGTVEAAILSAMSAARGVVSLLP